MKKVFVYVLTIFSVFSGIKAFATTAEAVIVQPKEALTKDVGQIAAEENEPEYLLFKINYVYRPGGKGEFIPLTKDSVLQSGDHYKIIFTPSVDCYVYIFQVDSGNKIYQLFPMEHFGGVTVKNFNPVQKGKTYYIPAEGKSFQLDEHTGRETMYFLASQQRDVALEEHYQQVFEEQQRPKSDLETQLEQIDQLLGHVIKVQGALTAPENAEKISWEEDGQTFFALQERLENMCNGCVYVLTFEHQ